MIRSAVDSDIPEIVKMGRKLARQSSYDEIIGFDAESVGLTVLELIESDDGIALVCEQDNHVVGIVTAKISPAFLNRNHLGAHELWMWVEPEYRGHTGPELLKALDKVSRERGALSLSVTAQESIRPKATGKLYQRAGFRPTDHTYMKGI